MKKRRIIQPILWTERPTGAQSWGLVHSGRVSVLVIEKRHRTLVDIKDLFCKVASDNRRGFRNLMFSLCFTFLGGSFVFLDVGPSIFIGCFIHRRKRIRSTEQNASNRLSLHQITCRDRRSREYTDPTGRHIAAS
jgi:hypothetical protein